MPVHSKEMSQPGTGVSLMECLTLLMKTGRKDMADARVVDAHEAPAARRVVRVRPSHVVVPVVPAAVAEVAAAMFAARATVSAGYMAAAVLVAGRLQLVTV